MPKSFQIRRNSDTEMNETQQFDLQQQQQQQQLSQHQHQEDDVQEFTMSNLFITDHLYSLKAIPTSTLDDWTNKVDTLLAAAQLLKLKENFNQPSVVDNNNNVSLSRHEDLPSPTESEQSSVDSLTDSLESPKYQCNQCHKIFKTKYTLTIHQRMPDHTKTRPFVCSVCGKGFRLSSTLCRHKIIHTAEKPHRCTFCDKAFNRSSTLKTHMKIHSTEKDFVCNICGKGFHQKGNLRNHMLVHTGEKPHACHVCYKAFSKLSNLKFHLQSHKLS